MPRNNPHTIETKNLISKGLTKHGMKNTRFYHIWESMKNRCKNKTSQNFKRYGGRGISYAKDWEGFQKFKDDMYESYLIHSNEFTEKNTTIDRIDNNKGYSKENCRWATRSEQLYNNSRTHYITINGVTKCITEWANLYNIKAKTVGQRINKYNWNPIVAVTTPVVPRKEKYKGTFRNKTPSKDTINNLKTLQDSLK